jgi:F-type H+-transporting ATPase subunit gamma
MPSLSEFRKKIKGVSSTRQITKAMKMVAGARFARAARSMNDALHYQAELEKVTHTYLSLIGSGRTGGLFSLFRLPGKGPVAPAGRIGVVVVAGDKGLCGDFNNTILRTADRYLKDNAGQVAVLIATGRKSVERYRNAKVPVKIEHAQFFNRFDFGMADTIGQEAIKLYLDHGLDELVVVRSHFKSMIKQELTVERLLPIEPKLPEDSLYRCTITEPEEEQEILQTLLPMYLKARLYGILRASFTAELAARMLAMDNATRNAGTLIDTITLEMNKVRQAVITRELAEIIATNEVVK